MIRRLSRPQRLTLLWLALIALKGGLVVWMAEGRDSPDAQLYTTLAGSLAEGEGLARGGTPTAMVVPGYPILLSLVLRLAPESEVPGLLVNVLLSAVVAFAYARLFVLLTGRARWGNLAAVALFLYPPHIQYACALTTEMANTACLALALLWWEQTRRHPERFTSWMLTGLFHAGAFMIRPVTFLLTPVILLWPLVEVRFRARALIGAVLAGLVILALWLPWVVRNHRALGRTIPLTTYSGITLLASTLDDFQDYEGPVQEELARAGISDFFADEVHSNRVLTDVAKGRIADDPGHHLRISLQRSWRFWIHDHPWHREFGARWRAADRPHDYLPLLGRPALQLLSVLLLTGLMASIWTLRRRRDCWPHILLLVYYTVLHALLFPIIRYSVPVQGLALVLIATAAVELLENRTARVPPC